MTNFNGAVGYKFCSDECSVEPAFSVFFSLPGKTLTTSHAMASFVMIYGYIGHIIEKYLYLYFASASCVLEFVLNESTHTHTHTHTLWTLEL